MTTTDKDRKYGPVVLDCLSKSDPTKEPYHVRMKDGHFSCNCPGFIFCKQKKANGDKRCKHVDAAESLMGQTEVNQGSSLDRLLLILNPLRKQITEAMRTRLALFLKDLEKNAPAEPAPALPQPSQMLIQTGVRRIIFDD